MVDFGPWIFKNVFRTTKVASYIKEMRPAINLKIKHGFMVSAFSLIGIDLAYETWAIFGKELPEFRESQDLFYSSAFEDTSVFSYSEYAYMQGQMESRELGYALQAIVDGSFISLFFLPKIPVVKRWMVKGIP